LTAPQQKSEIEAACEGKTSLEVMAMLLSNNLPKPDRLPDPSDFGLAVEQVVAPTLDTFGLTMVPKLEEEEEEEEEDYMSSTEEPEEDGEGWRFQESEAEDNLLEYNRLV